MKLIGSPTKRLEYTHRIKFNRKEYVREEVIRDENFHTILWKKASNSDLYEYYNCHSGWAKDSKMGLSNPVPEIEIIFKETVGKNLIYLK